MATAKTTQTSAPWRDEEAPPGQLIAVVALAVSAVAALVPRRLGGLSIVIVDAGFACAGLALATRLPAVWRHREHHLCAFAGALVLAFLLPSAVAHSSTVVVAQLFRFGGAVSVAFLFGSLRLRARVLAVVALAAAGVVHAVVAVGQRLRGGPLGLAFIGESPAGVHTISGPAPFGMMTHPYVLSAGAVVIGAVVAVEGIRLRSSRLALVSGACFLPVGLTMSRSGAMAAAAVVATLALAALLDARTRSYVGRLALAALMLGAALGVASSVDGWLGRAAKSTGPRALGGRESLFGQARNLLEAYPVLGVGPGQYQPALRARPDLQGDMAGREPILVHNAPVLVLVEGGLVVLPALLGLAVAVGASAWRGRLLGLAVLVAFLPHILLDHLAWARPQGIFLLGVWLGCLDGFTRPRADLADDERHLASA